MDSLTIGFLGGVSLVLLFATTVIHVLRRKKEHGIDPAVLETLHARVRAWWLLFGSLVAAFLLGPLVTVILFIVLSFWAFQEYITLTPTRPADNNTLSFVIFGLPLLQFVLVGLDREWFYHWFRIDSYLVFSILIPAYVFLTVPAFIAMSGDAKHFLERIAKIQVGLLICVYSLSFAPALLTMELPQTAKKAEIGRAVPTPLPGGVEAKIARDLHLEADTLISPHPKMRYENLRLLFFLILIVQFSDIFVYLWSQIRTRHLIAPAINSTRTWEGAIGGTATTTLLGTALWWFTPLAWWQAGLASMAVSLMGLAGGLTMSAIKRDCGVDDYGTLIEGHSGVLDRIDSLCFAAPVFYHAVWILTR